MSACGALQIADQLGPGHFGHDHVADDQIELLLLEQLDGFGAARAGDRLVIEVLQRIDGRGAHPRIVLDQQDARAGNDASRSRRAGAAGCMPDLGRGASVRGR